MCNILVTMDKPIFEEFTNEEDRVLLMWSLFQLNDYSSLIEMDSVVDMLEATDFGSRPDLFYKYT